MWEFTIEPSGAQRSMWDEQAFGMRVMACHWLLVGRRLQFPDVEGFRTGVPLLDLFVKNQEEDANPLRHMNELEIRHLNRTTLIIGEAGSTNPEEQLIFHREKPSPSVAHHQKTPAGSAFQAGSAGGLF